MSDTTLQHADLTITVIQHLAFEDLGAMASLLHSQGYTIEYLQAGVDTLTTAITNASILIILGGPIGVYETSTYPFLTEEIAALETRIQCNLPTLGICLGAQLIAKASGASVYSGAHKEIGWGTLTITNEGMSSAIAALHDTHVLHWHGDTFDLPKNAVHLAASTLYQHQAFSIGSNILAVQFHPEIETLKFERWLIGHACELSHAKIDIQKLRFDNLQYGNRLEQAGALFLLTWLSGIRL